MSKIGVIINTKDPEICWNAMRFGLTALLDGHEVKVFLMGAAVEIEGISHPKFNPSEIIKSFQEEGGTFMVCGACQDSRGQKSELCPANIMNDAVNLVVESDKLVTFG